MCACVCSFWLDMDRRGTAQRKTTNETTTGFCHSRGEGDLSHLMPTRTMSEPFISHIYLWHTGLGTLRIVGERGRKGVDATTSFTQEWIFFLLIVLLFRNTKVCCYN